MATGIGRRGHCRVAVPPASANPSQPVVLAGQPSPEPATTTRTRNNRNRRAPARYRDAVGDSEFIDINNISEEGSDDDVPDGTRAHPPAHTMPAAWTTPNPVHAGVGITPLAATTTPNQASPNLATGRSSKPPLTSADIQHFFEKSKEADTICKVCQDQQTANGKLDHGFMLSWNTSNYSLHAHIANWHLDEYLELAEKNNWSVQVDPVRKAFSTKGYTFRTLRDAIRRGHKLNALPPVHFDHRDSQARDFLPLSEKNMPAIPNFSLAAMHEYLVRFIVTDDQVRKF
ncbi:hypothetical protein JVT61DRAFT_9123 [Boletus reticuloceps]|uniref:Uncharacterized protein n=1 Tax=Boletus reticuloceps TaxID=495285 RepID=A0A8I2YGI6_9AGAM|nr:hypothetical protein JVT61DRAFT_9123 [Boletus reticuloceps]